MTGYEDIVLQHFVLPYLAIFYLAIFFFRFLSITSSLVSSLATLERNI